MANISVTYSFSNGTTADASQVNTNFTDIINGTSDGTKDFSINALTVAGAATFNGNVTLGNASSDDLTFTASMASTLPIKTTNTYDIGSSTLGLRAAYFGANSQTVKLQGSSSMSATWTFTFPVTAGTVNYVMETDGSGVGSWVEQIESADQLRNISIACSVGASALTITMNGADGNALSATNYAKIKYRSSTATSGTPATVKTTSSPTLTVSSGSTLGHTSAEPCEFFVYAINNAGTTELAVSTILFDDGTLVSTTAEGGAGAADSRTVMYSTTARTDVACRLLARLKSTQTVAGTWAAVPTEVSLVPFSTPPAYSDWVTYTPTGSWSSNVTYTGKWRRVGGEMSVRVKIACSGAPTTAALTVNLPTGYHADSTRLMDSSTNNSLGFGGLFDASTYVGLVNIRYSSTTAVEVRAQSQASPFNWLVVSESAPMTFANNDLVYLDFTVPIIGWS